jgi:hypothetical protein
MTDDQSLSYEAEACIMTMNCCLVTSMGEDTLCKAGRKMEGGEDVVQVSSKLSAILGDWGWMRSTFEGTEGPTKYSGHVAVERVAASLQ